MRPLDFLKRRYSALILLAVAGYCLVYALAFVRLYFLEHPYKIASYWIFDNVPPGSRLVGPHWDDKVPVSVAGKNNSVYVMEGRDNELPVYERDTPQMIESIVRRVSLSDYIMFPTPRTPDSIPRIPDEYPNTTALLRLLWGEKIGFKLVKTFKNRPSLLGITFNDDLADESFSVYDHPKVTVFQNVEKLSSEEILRRVKDVDRFQPLPTMDEMLLMDEGGWKPSARLWNPEWNSLCRMLGALLLLAVSTWIAFGGVFRRFPDAGLGLSLVSGLVFASGVSWLLSLGGFVPLTRSGAMAVTLGIAAFALARICLGQDVRARTSASMWAHGVPVLVAVLCGAIVSLVMRTSDPGFFGIGEEVDAAYLSYLSRTVEPIPQDIFQAGNRLPLRMVDRFIFGWLLKLVGIDAALSVKAGSVIIGAVIGGLLYSFASLFVRNKKVAFVVSLVALIPSAYALHVVRDSANRAVVGNDDGALLRTSAASGELARWVRKTIQGTPCFVAACDGDDAGVLPVLIGLPVCGGSLRNSAGKQGGENQHDTESQYGKESQYGALCNLEEPSAAFTRMMELGVELFVTPAEQAARSENSRRRISGFIQRPELFSKIFDDGNYAVFVPSFSRYFPRAKDPLSS